MGLCPLSEVAKEVYLRIDQEEDSGLPSLTKNGVYDITKSVFDVISQAILAGESVMVPKFGKFDVFVKKASTARNPKTGKSIDVPERLTVKFRVSSALKLQLREADLPEEEKPKKKAAKKKASKKKKK